MQNNLVIVESPAKAKTIEKFLGKDYKVMSSYGHIRDLKKREFSVNIDNFEPYYEVPPEKKKLAQELKEAAQKASTVWLASDEDREGEAISWHLFEVLGLSKNKTKRIVFHEITKDAILKAIERPRDIDINLVYAQQARRVLDRIVGFKLSPILWRKIKPALSAGRVQSVAVRLLVEREREINAFSPEASYRVVATFSITGSEKKWSGVKGELKKRFTDKNKALVFLEKCVDSTFTVSDVTTRSIKKSPAPPFTTSTLQQEAARKFGFTVIQTMMLAQRLYESGKITYMRTDSVNLSPLFIESCKSVITDKMGKEYAKSRNYKQKAKGAQEAHEAIRPTSVELESIEGNTQERRLYELIRKRAIASQMSDAEILKTSIEVTVSGASELFVISGESVKFDGFLKVYRETVENDSDESSESSKLPILSKGDVLQYDQICASQRFTQRPLRYNEAALVSKLEELGIGRPSTYAPTINTIQQREYVIKDDVEGNLCEYNLLKLEKGKISDDTLSEYYGKEKSKLIPTDVGIVVSDFLCLYFPDIMDYNFTAKVEKEFDDVAEGKNTWDSVIRSFYTKFGPMVDEILTSKNELKVGEHILGNDPVTGKPVSAKIGRFGPIIQIGSADDEEKPRFAQMRKGQTIETITLEEALELFKLPRNIGEFEDTVVTIGAGRFGPYVRFGKQYVSIGDKYDPLEISLDQAIDLILKKREAEAKRVIKRFEQDSEMELLNGRYGPYISYQGSNYKIPKQLVPEELSYEESLEIVNDQIKKRGNSTKRRYFKRKK